MTTADKTPKPAAATSVTTPGLLILETSYIVPAHGDPFYEIAAQDEQDTDLVFLTRDLPLWDDAVTAWSSGSRVSVTRHHGSRIRRVLKRPDETIAVKVATAIGIDTSHALAAPIGKEAVTV